MSGGRAREVGLGWRWLQLSRPRGPGLAAGGATVSPGGEGKPGRVVDIRGWDVETGRSVASVSWADGTTNVYRMGHKGKVDLKCVAEAAGGFYYKEHLPILGKGCPAALPPWARGRGDGAPPEWACCLSPGKPAELQRRVSADSQTFQHGDKVKCLLDADVLREMQEGHGGWNPRMAEFIGQTGTVHRITARGDVRVQFSHETRWTFHPRALTKVLGGLDQAPSPPHPLHVPAQPRRRREGLVGISPTQRGSRCGGRARHASHWQLGPAARPWRLSWGRKRPDREASWAGGVAGLAFSNAPSGEGEGRPVRTGECSAQGARLG